MGSSEEKVVAVIMVGGPTKGTRFRPLSLNIPKPLFPLAGQAMVHHPISACKRIPNLVQIYLVGFYEEREFALYVSSVSNELRVPVRYLKEDKPHGSAGELYNFRDLIMEDNPSHIFLLNCDVCYSFPLPEMRAESANQFGELVADPITNELLHYTEKPETFVSDLINCGVYIFTPDIFTAIQDLSTQRKDRANLRRVSSFEALFSQPQTCVVIVIFMIRIHNLGLAIEHTSFNSLNVFEMFRTLSCTIPINFSSSSGGWRWFKECYHCWGCVWSSISKSTSVCKGK
ncbi:hypothetical protein IFM89_013462 [Coptis chinensis]|uniref:Nucleotidyl transferase domain-containing protein n=1 Tax=Coptis chinensis TaxID=261450 RepID=A0A835LVD2_9MAGN|nr:hypothetical protein IFM89_013462 [Coptis chinensis]